MIQMRSILDVADNSGARKISVINPIPANATMVQIPSEPGLGIALDEAKVHRYRAN